VFSDQKNCPKFLDLYDNVITLGPSQHEPSDNITKHTLWQVKCSNVQNKLAGFKKIKQMIIVNQNDTLRGNT
jgi:hypothetical protein